MTWISEDLDGFDYMNFEDFRGFRWIWDDLWDDVDGNFMGFDDIYGDENRDLKQLNGDVIQISGNQTWQ